MGYRHAHLAVLVVYMLDMIKVDKSMLKILICHVMDQLYATSRLARGNLKDIRSAIKILPEKFVHLDKRILTLHFDCKDANSLLRCLVFYMEGLHPQGCHFGCLLGKSYLKDVV